MNICKNCGGILIPNFDKDGKLISQCNVCKQIDNTDINIQIENSTNKWVEKNFKNTKKNLLEKEDKIIVISYLKAIREKRGISQKQMADLFGFTEQRYGNVERNYNAPSIVLVSQFAYILEVPAGDIYRVVKVSKKIYDEIKCLKVDKNDIYLSEELRDIMNNMLFVANEKDIINNKLKKCNELKDEDIAQYTELKKQYDEKSEQYKDLKKQYDKHISSAFLKGGLVESSSWELYLKLKSEEEIKENIQELIRNE